MMNDTKELDQLLDLAEKVSATISDLNDKITKIKLGLLYIGLLIFFPALISVQLQISESSLAALEIPLKIITVIFVVGFSSLFVMGSRKLKNLTKSKKIESSILHDLLQMVHEYRYYLYDGKIGSVERAIIEMRLKRIEFSEGKLNKL